MNSVLAKQQRRRNLKTQATSSWPEKATGMAKETVENVHKKVSEKINKAQKVTQEMKDHVGEQITSDEGDKVQQAIGATQQNLSEYDTEEKAKVIGSSDDLEKLIRQKTAEQASTMKFEPEDVQHTIETATQRVLHEMKKAYDQARDAVHFTEQKAKESMTAEGVVIKIDDWLDGLLGEKGDKPQQPKEDSDAKK